MLEGLRELNLNLTNEKSQNKRFHQTSLFWTQTMLETWQMEKWNQTNLVCSLNYVGRLRWTSEAGLEELYILVVYNSIPTTISNVFWQKAKLHYLLEKHQRENLADKAPKLYKVIENPNYFDFSRNLGKILWAMNFWLKPHFRGLILLTLLPQINTRKGDKRH